MVFFLLAVQNAGGFVVRGRGAFTCFVNTIFRFPYVVPAPAICCAFGQRVYGKRITDVGKQVSGSRLPTTDYRLLNR